MIVSIAASIISGADDPSAIRVRLATVGFQTRTDISISSPKRFLRFTIFSADVITCNENGCHWFTGCVLALSTWSAHRHSGTRINIILISQCIQEFSCASVAYLNSAHKDVRYNGNSCIPYRTSLAQLLDTDHKSKLLFYWAWDRTKKTPNQRSTINYG